MFDIMYLVLGLVISLVLFYTIFVYKNWKILKFASKENGLYLPWLPVFGHTYLVVLLSLKVNIASILQCLATNIGLPCGIWIGHTFCYCTDDPSEIKAVLNRPECYEKAKLYENLKFLFRNSILLVPYEEWKHRRRLYQKSFKPIVLKSFFHSFYEESCNLLKEIETGTNDLYQMCNKYAFTNFFYTSVGLNKEELLDKMDRFGELLHMIQEELVTLMLDPITPANIWYAFYPAGRRTKRMIKEADFILKKVIKAKRKQYNDQGVYHLTDDGLSPLMDLMMVMPESRIFEEILLFASAATDATGISIAFTFTLLGMNPGAQETIYNEVISVAGSSEIIHDNLSDLKYTEAAICESLRLLPPVAFIGRNVKTDVNIGTKVLPKGINCVIDIFHLHRDPKYWRDPLKFDPTRFLPENSSKIQSYTYLPFSAGPKDCMGKNQAMMLLKITIANVVRKFKITSKYKSVEELTLTSCITMKSSHPLDCHFTPRIPR